MLNTQKAAARKKMKQWIVATGLISVMAGLGAGFGIGYAVGKNQDTNKNNTSTQAEQTKIESVVDLNI